jgi:hypothetical protein
MYLKEIDVLLCNGILSLLKIIHKIPFDYRQAPLLAISLAGWKTSEISSLYFTNLKKCKWVERNSFGAFTLLFPSDYQFMHASF